MAKKISPTVLSEHFFAKYSHHSNTLVSASLKKLQKATARRVSDTELKRNMIQSRVGEIIVLVADGPFKYSLRRKAKTLIKSFWGEHWKKLVLTRSLGLTIAFILGVGALYGIVGFKFYFHYGKTSCVDYWTLINDVVKFCAWLMFSYGTIQVFGRAIEYENIEKKIDDVDRKARIDKAHAFTNSAKNEIENNKQEDYKKQVEAIKRIEKDNQTTMILYLLAIFLYFGTFVADSFIQALQN